MSRAMPDVTKKILKEIATDYLPHEWMFRKKKGFGLPANAWAQDDVMNMCRDLIGGDSSYLARYLSHQSLKDTLENQARPGHFSIYQMWPLLILELWLRAQAEKIAAAQSGKVSTSTSAAIETTPVAQESTKPKRGFFEKLRAK